MLKSDKLEFERGAAAKTENQDRYNGKENRHHDRDGTAGSSKSPASISPVEILSKDRAGGGGVLCSSDTATVTTDRKFLSFMRSYPNLIPLSAAKVTANCRRARLFSVRRNLRSLLRSRHSDGRKTDPCEIRAALYRGSKRCL
jgi:hypothetical protein